MLGLIYFFLAYMTFSGFLRLLVTLALLGREAIYLLGGSRQLRQESLSMPHILPDSGIMVAGGCMSP